MNKKFIFLFAIIFFMIFGCKDNRKYKVTLIEIMSNSCEPCITEYKAMIEELKNEFKNQVKFLIYDTSTEQGAEMAHKYDVIKLPTFIFLDENGVEYFRLKDIIIKDAMAALIKTKLENNKKGK